jgi:hypothetical protein
MTEITNEDRERVKLLQLITSIQKSFARTIKTITRIS